jgi:hypothetical protein
MRSTILRQLADNDINYTTPGPSWLGWHDPAADAPRGSWVVCFDIATFAARRCEIERILKRNETAYEIVDPYKFCPLVLIIVMPWWIEGVEGLG